jgi:hypothetical protein
MDQSLKKLIAQGYFVKIIIRYGDIDDMEQMMIQVYLPELPVVGDNIRFSNNDGRQPDWLETTDEEDWNLLKDTGIVITSKEFDPYIKYEAKIWEKS